MDFRIPTPNFYSAFRDIKSLYWNTSTGELLMTLLRYRLASKPWMAAAINKGIVAVQSVPGLRGLCNYLYKKVFWNPLCGAETLEDALKITEDLKIDGMYGLLLPITASAESEEDWERNTVDRVNVLERVKNNEDVSFLSIRVSDLAPRELLEKVTWLIRKYPEDWKSLLEPNETEQFEKVFNRVKRICEAASRCDTPIFITGEQDGIQAAIDYIGINLSEMFNKNSAVVYNTYQMYFLESLDKWAHHITMAKERGFYLGCNIVRGGFYKEEDRMGNDRLVHNSMLVTQAHKKVLVFGLLEVKAGTKISLMFGTHNLETILTIGKICGEINLPFSTPNLHIGQLKGMAKNVSLTLADFRFNVSKVIPYGEFTSTLPYIQRRIEETGHPYAATKFEEEMIWLELKRRKFGLERTPEKNM